MAKPAPARAPTREPRDRAGSNAYANYVLGVLVLIGARERRAAGIRQTRATLMGVRKSVDSYIADHDGGCPPALADVGDFGRTDGVPRDAWGRPLRLVCPGRFEGAPFELMSDGPDGEPGGLDRIE